MPAKRKATATRRPKSNGYVEPGNWYRIAFSNGDAFYFQALSMFKNGNVQGKTYVVEADRPRKKAKGKLTSTPHHAPTWKEIPLSEVPFKRFAEE